MVGIVRVGGLPETYAAVNGGQRPKTTSDGLPKSEDTVSLSSEAKTAAIVADYITAAGVDPEVRQERIEQARKNIEEGTHRINEVLKLVAGRIHAHITVK